jgi:hypothetical protein
MPISFSKAIHWHDKGFTLSWSGLNARWVLVHFVNGQRKPWYKRTERPYRFRRWFIRKGEDSFSNIANVNEPRLTLYVFSWYIAFPKKIVVPMQVNALRVREPETVVYPPEVKPVIVVMDNIEFDTNMHKPIMEVLDSEIEVSSSKISLLAFPGIALNQDYIRYKASSIITPQSSTL